MKKILLPLLLILIIISFTETRAVNLVNLVNKIKLASKDLPEGFVFGKVPGFAKKVLKNNPWMMDKRAIRKLTHRIYPGGNYSNIDTIHMTIVARKNRPYGDDIVCYIISYKNRSAAEKEIKKLNTHKRYNQDRAIVIAKGKVAIYIFVDNTKHFPIIREMANNMEIKLRAM